MNTPVETLEFQAEARQLLQLMVHSIYSNKDTFLRELISNASDALDKLRLETYRDKDLAADTSDLRIELVADRVARTLTIRDNGIGMSRDEVVGLIGTIAKSGTAEFLRKLKESKDSAAGPNQVNGDLIGQFGVGFYSSFMVADHVTLLTRKAGEDTGTRWESAGEGTYTIETVDDAPQGTSVILKLKPEDTEDHLYDYTAEWKLREIVTRYSDFITWPVRLEVERTVEDKTTREFETVNSGKALWARSKDEVPAEEYTEFYKHISRDWNEPLEMIQVRAEGTFEYQALLFLPAKAPYDLFMRERKRGVQLYVKRVFIMDDCEALMPEYLRFVKGVVDAQDLSLNVSREILQQDRQIQLMRRRLVKRVLSTVKTMMTDAPEKYATFWTEFGPAVKEGLLSDAENRETILDIASFASTHSEEPTSLADYVERMPDDQEHIYYMTGASRSIVESSPHLEAFRAKGIEVLILTDAIDEMWVDAGDEYRGKKFQSVAKGQVDLDQDRKPEEAGEFEPLLTWLSENLTDSVKQVRLSSRLTTSPACLVGEAGDLTPTLEKMYRAMGQPVPTVKRVLELNPEHELVTGMRTAFAAGGHETELGETAELLYGMALLAEGGELPDPAKFTKVLAERLAKSL